MTTPEPWCPCGCVVQCAGYDWRLQGRQPLGQRYPSGVQERNSLVQSVHPRPIHSFPSFQFPCTCLLIKETKDRGEGMKRGPASTGGEAEVLTTQQIILLPGESVREEKCTCINLWNLRSVSPFTLHFSLHQWTNTNPKNLITIEPNEWCQIPASLLLVSVTNSSSRYPT